MRRAILILSLVLTTLTIVATPSAQSAAPRLHLDVRFAAPDPAVAQRLTDVGFEIELAAPALGRWQGWLPADRLDELRTLDGVTSVQRPQYARFAAGAAITEGDEALNAATARATFNVDGSDVRVAVISDGIVGLQQAQLASEAPKLVEARAFGAGDLNRGQEGTAMIEIIHDLAPGASISFAAVLTDLDHITAVNYFAQRVDIIIDDISYAFPANQRSDVSVNTTTALQHPTWPLRLYVTAAGNWAESHWAGAWRAGPDGSRVGLLSPGAVHQFGATDTGTLYGVGNSFAVEPEDQIRLALFWDDPWGRSYNDYNLYLISESGSILAASEDTQGVGLDSHNPREHLEYVHQGKATELFVVIQNHNDDAEPVEFDLFAFHAEGAQIRLHYRTTAGSILAQSDAEGALTVGAVNVGEQAVAPYSSRGPTANGAFKPEISAVDRVTVSDTTRFGPRFSGSSAAAPHVAGVAALLLQAQPALLAGDGGSPLLERRLIRDILTDTARDIPPDGPDLASGAGLIDADAAIQTAISRVAVINSAADSGPGTFREAINSGARMLLFQNTQEDRTIRLRSALPIVPADMIIDGTGWAIDASAVDVGLELGARAELWGLSVNEAQEVGILLTGDQSRLIGVTTNGNITGIRVNGANATIEGATVANGRSHGIEIGDGGSASISASTIESNRGAGVMIHPAAGDVLIGPTIEPPTLSPASDLPIPIGRLDSPPLQPRAGLSHSISGTVSVDGLPAAAGTTVDLYLDRRLAASVMVDQAASFNVTATGPGAELRFAVNGVPLDQRVDFEAGATSSISLRAVSSPTLVTSDSEGVHLSEANLLRNNLSGVEIMPVDGERAGSRQVWGNMMQRNRDNITSEFAAPTIDLVEWAAASVSISGRAKGVSIVHLYAGPQDSRHYVGSMPVIGGLFRFQHVNVSRTVSEFSVIGHTVEGRATSESAVHREPLPGSITSITPLSGYIEGGEPVRICGARISDDAAVPQIWFGNREARVMFWSGECVTVTTPPALAGLTDIALRLPGSRPIVALDAFEYRAVRTVQLKQGWNFVTWRGADTRVTTAFASLAGATFRAYAWDADRQQWRLFATELPPQLNTLRSIEHNQPLWILLDTPAIDWQQPAPD